MNKLKKLKLILLMTNLLHPLITSMLYQFDSMAYNKKYTCYVKNNIKNEFCIPNLVILEVLHAKIYPFLKFWVFKMAADRHLDLWKSPGWDN